MGRKLIWKPDVATNEETMSYWQTVGVIKRQFLLIFVAIIQDIFLNYDETFNRFRSVAKSQRKPWNVDVLYERINFWSNVYWFRFILLWVEHASMVCACHGYGINLGTILIVPELTFTETLVNLDNGRQLNSTLLLIRNIVLKSLIATIGQHGLSCWSNASHFLITTVE